MASSVDFEYTMKDAEEPGDRTGMQMALRDDPTVERLWETLIAFEGEPFRTAKGLEYTYRIRGGEIFVSRRDKSITKATVGLAFQKALALGAEATGPKKLGVFGASYLYPVFIRLGIIPAPETSGMVQMTLFDASDAADGSS